MKVWLIASILLIILLVYWLANRARCKCRGACVCKQADEAFVDDITRMQIYEACPGRTDRQVSYSANICAVSTNMVKPILDSLADDIITYNKIGKAYTDIIVNTLVPRASQSYTQKYDEMLNAFIAFERNAFTILSSADRAIPDNYSFVIPDAISIGDYAPGVATWEAAALQPKSFKCGLFNASELDSLERLKNRPNRAGRGTAAQQLLTRAQANICSSKGYFYSDGSFASRGCVDCNGCCVPSSDELPSMTASELVCPRPKVRPFHIPARKIRLRIVSPNLKKDLECYANYARDVHDITKSEKFISMQLGR